ncbi:MAG TPA: hypothetical protein VKM55_23170 [Candidatus Lokiarchaeia archaeon]|nr:hypothetical protein [Candidatus Lokiarchaeia archaeon]
MAWRKYRVVIGTAGLAFFIALFVVMLTPINFNFNAEIPGWVVVPAIIIGLVSAVVDAVLVLVLWHYKGKGNEKVSIKDENIKPLS